MITLTQGTTVYTLRLANWLGADAYRQYTRSLPLAQEESIIGEDEFRQPVSPDILTWSADSWKGGEGETMWRESRPDIYHESFNVRPLITGDGLELGAAQQASLDDDGAGGIHNEGARLGVGLGKLWAATDNTAHEWQPSTENWDATGITVQAANSELVNMADPRDAYIYAGAANSHIYRFKSGTNHDWLTSGLTKPAVLVAFGGLLYLADWADLYVLDVTIAAGTSLAAAGTKKYDGGLTSTAGAWFNDTDASYFRLSTSDVGPIWVWRYDDGRTFIYEYNHFEDTTRVRAQLPDFIWPSDLAFFNGFSFTAFRYAQGDAVEGDAYLYYERGGQRGIAGPFRSQTGITASKSVRIGGMIGSDVIVAFDGAVWAYDLSTGGISQIADTIATPAANAPTQVLVYGKDIFLGGMTSGANTDSVERLSTGSYTTQTGAFLSSGSLDFRMPGVDKTLLEIVVITDPLPESTSLQVAYAADGAGFTTHATTATGKGGNATFDFTGGTSEDLWTDATHGLSVNDVISFVAVGTGAPEYTINTRYYVVTAADANTFQLSATKGGAVLAGTVDSTGTWTWVGGEARHTFTVSNSTTSVDGKTFEVRVLPTTTATANSPTIRNVTATAVTTAKRWFYDFLLDLGDTGTEAGVAQEAAQVLADLKALETTGGVWSLSNPHDVREHDAASTTEVIVKDVDSAAQDTEYGFVGRIRLAAVSPV